MNVKLSIEIWFTWFAYALAKNSLTTVVMIQFKCQIQILKWPLSSCQLKLHTHTHVSYGHNLGGKLQGAKSYLYLELKTHNGAKHMDFIYFVSGMDESNVHGKTNDDVPTSKKNFVAVVTAPSSSAMMAHLPSQGYQSPPKLFPTISIEGELG